MFGKTKEVNISLSNDMAAEAAHGVLWARKPGMEVVEELAFNGFNPMHFRVDRPHLLADPKRSTIRSVFEQAKLLGLELLHVELNVKGEKKFYAFP